MKPFHPLFVLCSTLALALSAVSSVYADAPPNFRGEHSGSYTYGEGYPEQQGDRVTTSIKVSQLPDSAEIYGVMTEAYSNFGVPKEGKLWADIEGSVAEVNGEIIISFTKTYRYFEQEPVTYVGVYVPGAKEVRGLWYFKGTEYLGGSFMWEGVTLAQ